MTFIEILPLLNAGCPVRRASFDPAFIIFKQVPASFDDVSNIKSLPPQVKVLLASLGVGIDYENQYLIYDFVTGVATSCCFDGDDVTALDWEVVDVDYNPFIGIYEEEE